MDPMGDNILFLVSIFLIFFFKWDPTSHFLGKSHPIFGEHENDTANWPNMTKIPLGSAGTNQIHSKLGLPKFHGRL